MKGVILAGGLGTRLLPLTLVANKQTLPVYNKPMIYHVVEFVKDAGITDIMIIIGRERCGDVISLLGSGRDFGVTLTYRIQEEANGIAGALRLCKDFVGTDSVLTVLGDNLLENSIRHLVDEYDGGAMVFVKEVPDPQRFGVATLNDEGRVTKIIEKPQHPETNLAIIGVYIYDSEVFDIIDALSPSARGEYEITDVNQRYLERDKLHCRQIEGWWSDAGTIDSLYKASVLIEKRERNLRRRKS